MARKTKLRPGKGATALILTRFIKPNQPLPGNNKDHRSSIVLLDRINAPGGKVVYKIRYEMDTEGECGDLYAAVRYVKVTREGDPNSFFDGPSQEESVAFEEPKKRWANSHARRLLYDDVRKGVVQIDENGTPLMPLEDIYSMRPEYSEYDHSKFSDRLKGIIGIVRKMESRAEEDYEALRQYKESYPVSYMNWKGYIQWQGSESQRLALIDLEAKQHITLGYRQLYEKRPEYYNEFPFDSFRDKCRQEISTNKYLHTLRVKGKQHPSS
eukprot:scaffold4993_cov73-Cylindrotheca_fusiformis.AAC.3